MVNKELLQSALDEIKATEDFKNKIVAKIHNHLSDNIHFNHNSIAWLKKSFPIAVSLIVVVGIVIFIFFKIDKMQNVGKSGEKASICMVEVNNNLYFENEAGNSGLCVYDKNTKKVTDLHTDYVVSLIAAGNLIYFTTINNELELYNASTGEIKSLYASMNKNQSCTVNVFYADDQNVYFVTNDYKDANGASESGLTNIYRLSISDNKSNIIYSSDKGAFRDLKMIDNSIYYRLVSDVNGGIYKFSLDGNSVQKIYSRELLGNYFLYAGKFVFVSWDKDASEDVYTINMDGSDLTKISPSKLRSNAFSIYNNLAFFDTLEAFYKYDLDTGEFTKLNIKDVTCIYAVKGGLYCYYPGHLWFYDLSTHESIDIQ